MADIAVSFSREAASFDASKHFKFLVAHGPFENIQNFISKKPWSPIVWANGYRAKKNFVSSSVISLDFDDGDWTVQDAIDWVVSTGVALLIVGSNPRKEAPVLNGRIRKRFVAGKFPIGVIGEHADLTYKAQHLGAGPETLKQVLAGTHPFAQVLKDAAKPMIIVGQGALAIECRAGNSNVFNLLKPLHHYATASCINAERAMSRTLAGSCNVPLAGHAELSGARLTLRGYVGLPDGTRHVSASRDGMAADASGLGRAVADELRARGAAEILATLDPA